MKKQQKKKLIKRSRSPSPDTPAWEILESRPDQTTIKVNTSFITDRKINFKVIEGSVEVFGTIVNSGQTFENVPKDLIKPITNLAKLTHSKH
jgi:hypothetical protein